MSKAHADVVLISGHDGGTGASPLTSLKHAGAPWELGLAETQQTLVLNGLRDRIVVQVDGQLKTGRDVVIAALLGAEEFGFATAPLVVSGCIMMRVCHLDTCPVGIATQNPELRARFSGKPEFVETFFEYIAEEVREHLAALGLPQHRGGDRPGRAPRHRQGRRALEGLGPRPRARSSRRSRARTGPASGTGSGQDHGLEKALDHQLIAAARDAIDHGEPVRGALRRAQRQPHGRHDARPRGHQAHPDGLPDGTIDLTLTGSAGQCFGAFLPAGVTLRLVGDANDYVGKGLSGGRHRRPAGTAARALVAEDNVIAGNVIGYGATSGEIFLRGRVGERFCVRNSGATAVVEGVGDHGLEYMTGGTRLDPRPHRPQRRGRHVRRRRLRPRPRRRRGSTPSSSTSRAAGGEDELVVHDLLERHVAAGPDSPVAARLLADWGTARSALHPGPAARLPARPRRAGRPRGGGPRPRRPPGVGADHGGIPWLTPKAFSRPASASCRAGGPSRCASGTGRRSTRTSRSAELQRQAGRCMDCGIPFCHSGCPLGNLIPEWNDLAWRGDWREAIERLHATNNFPEFTGRLCPAPCESACVLGINQPAVTIKQVEVTIIDRAFENGTVLPAGRPSGSPARPSPSSAPGPSGLAAAQQLTRAGHTVAVYERADQPGGLLRYGIPEFKMEKSVLDRRLAQMKAEGTRFRTGVDVGERPHRAPTSASASTPSSSRSAPPCRATCRCPGRELDGVHAGDGLPAAGQPGRPRPGASRAR